MTRCPWTGVEFSPATLGGSRKKFASTAARNAAHSAARQYTEHLIDQGFLSWEQVRAWYEAKENGGSPPCTTADIPLPHEAQAS